MKPKQSGNNLRAWREFRSLTQQQLAEKIGTTAAVISLLENGQRGLTAAWLNRLAPQLQVTPGFLLDHDPGDLTADILEAWSKVPENRRMQALLALREFSNNRSSGSGTV